ncbi:2-hydroxy-3-oxopropionate reductase [Thermocatellispora tengchongensis]|uniref:2-hydroxy-3-oxopropionate reductase n=1 Tax=Thermocatellispora tengchongensis TaxID=1073253 RepID=A0A840PM78_9ACTN|nr:2-hydroxy-3-oxopropionate reductase [Thermocatellispora tengchongensis]MBB5138147.1 2-hydroxy-3-oxopropionate reductase [Thermocatellispora tengchongensis]
MNCVGFVGLGIMGGPMAANLIRAGYTVTGFDLVEESVKRFTEAGGQAAASVADAVAGADVVITMLPDSPHVEEVALGPDGVLENAKPGTLYIDMSTVRPDTSRRVAEAAPARGVRALDAPVSGGEKGAIDGTLSIMVGGEAADFEAARQVLEVLGTTIVHVGPAGAGQTVKAANQLVVGGVYALVSEAIVLLESSGVDARKGMDVLAGGLAGSRILDLKRETMINREFKPGFRIDLHHKDMGIAVAAAREAGVALPMTGLVAQLIAAARAQGHGSLDHSALLKVIERMNR